jgi:hypothetical protein
MKEFVEKSLQQEICALRGELASKSSTTPLLSKVSTSLKSLGSSRKKQG